MPGAAPARPLERSVPRDGLQCATAAEVTVVAALPPMSALAGVRAVARGRRPQDEPVVLFQRGDSPVTFDYTVAQLHCLDHERPRVH